MSTHFARTVQQLTTEIGLLDLQAQLRAVEPALARLGADAPSCRGIEELLVQFRLLSTDAESLGHLRVAAVGRMAERLLEACPFAPVVELGDVAALVQRAHDLMLMLVHDARRRLDGRPAAALEGAIEALTDQIANLGCRQGWMSAPVVH